MYCASIFGTVVLSASLGSPSHLAAAAPELKEVQNLKLPELRSVTSVVVSSDGKFLYAASFAANTICTFIRDPATGQLDLIDTISDHPALSSVVNFCLSKDEKYAAASAFGSNALTLFKRDPETGGLSIVDAAYESAGPNRGLNFVVAACFSPSADFIYTGCSVGVGVYEIKGDKLQFVQSTDADGKLSGVRGVALSPNGDWVYATAMTSGNLAVFRRDATSGLVSAAQVLSNAESGTKSLNGAFHCAVSADGKFVYVNSGRFRGDQAVSAFTVADDGQLKLLQEFVNGTGEFTEFQGGNSLALTPTENPSWRWQLFRIGSFALSGTLLPGG
jgi:6-phosphogluconolactonase (cycloisomerase 2 family)